MNKIRIYAYSEAHQNLSGVLDEAESSGKVIIRRKDGKTYVIIPERLKKSPLDVASVSAKITSKEIVSIIRDGREKSRTKHSLR